MSTERELTYAEMKAALKTTLGRVHAFSNLTVDLRTLAQLNLSYSSSGEDMWLRQFMKARLRSGQPGFYVDIGCNQAVITSNTFLFYCYGWRGICVDANAMFGPEFAEMRPRDVFLHAAISDAGETLYFAELDAAGGHKMAQVARHPNDFAPGFKTPVIVPAMTMAALLQQHLPAGADIDFMSMDIEGSELAALRSNDWSRYKPRVILIEIVKEAFDNLAPLSYPTIRYLSELGYQYEGFGCNNVLMTSPDFGK